MLRHLPNLISILRILLVGPVIFYLLNGNYLLAWWLFIIAGISDGVDGYLARRFNWESELGKTLDPIGDKLLMVCTYFTLGWLHQLPLWLVVIVIARDVIIISGTVIYRRITGDRVISPIFISKLNTVFQILLVAAVVFSRAYWPIPVLISEVLIYVVALTTFASGTGYVSIWVRRAQEYLKIKQGEV